MRTFTRTATVIVFFMIALVPVALFGHGGPGRLNSYGPWRVRRFLITLHHTRFEGWEIGLKTASDCATRW